jgi:hypothetical protein
MNWDEDVEETAEEYFSALNNGIKRYQSVYQQFYLQSSFFDYKPLAQKITNLLNVFDNADPVFIPQGVTSKDQISWLASHDSILTNHPQKCIPVFIDGFSQEVEFLLKQGGKLDYIMSYYAHTQSQGRTIQPGVLESEKTRLYEKLQDSCKKIVVLNVITPTQDVKILDGSTVNPADLAYRSASQGDFSTLIKRNYTLALESDLFLNNFHNHSIER